MEVDELVKAGLEGGGHVVPGASSLSGMREGVPPSNVVTSPRFSTWGLPGGAAPCAEVGELASTAGVFDGEARSPLPPAGSNGVPPPCVARTTPGAPFGGSVPAPCRAAAVEVDELMGAYAERSRGAGRSCGRHCAEAVAPRAG